MAYAVLLMIGGALLLNGLAVLEVVDGKSIAVVNIFIGLLASAAPFYLLTQVVGSDGASLDKALSVAPMWLFALTFLWVGVNALTGHFAVGVGWYCLWVAVVAVIFSGINYFRLGGSVDSVVWLNWSFLWIMFWILLGLAKQRVARFTGWLAVIMSVWSVTLQGVLGMLGQWPLLPTWAYVGASAVTLVAALALSIPGHTDRRIAQSPRAHPNKPAHVAGRLDN